MFKKFKKLFIQKQRRRHYPNISKTSRIDKNVQVYSPNNLIMGEKTNIDSGGIIMNTRGKFIMADYSGAAIGLLVITGNHMSVVGKVHKQISDVDKDKSVNPKQYDKDIIVEEDVWIGARATLLYGAHIGRGAIVGAGAVVRTPIPPYSIVIGNPAKVVGFRFTPEEIMEHELNIFPPEKRLSQKEILQSYQKFFLNNIKGINKFIKPVLNS